mgnify:FL=1
MPTDTISVSLAFKKNIPFVASDLVGDTTERNIFNKKDLTYYMVR